MFMKLVCVIKLENKIVLFDHSFKLYILHIHLLFLNISLYCLSFEVAVNLKIINLKLKSWCWQISNMFSSKKNNIVEALQFSRRFCKTTQKQNCFALVYIKGFPC